MTAARTPWFSAQSQPPVNGGPDAVYEWRCPDRPNFGVQQRPAWYLGFCPHCQWRGLTKPAKEK